MRRERQKDRPNKPPHPREYYWAVNRQKLEGTLVRVMLLDPSDYCIKHIREALDDPRPVTEYKLAHVMVYVRAWASVRDMRSGRGQIR